MKDSEAKFVRDFIARPKAGDYESDMHELALSLEMMERIIHYMEGYTITQFPKYELQLLANADEKDLDKLARLFTNKLKIVSDREAKIVPNSVPINVVHKKEVSQDNASYQEKLEQFLQLQVAAQELLKQKSKKNLN